MEERTINQNGLTSIYIEKNDGQIFVGNAYVEDAACAFEKVSYELHDYTPSIQPAITREEVGLIKDWIDRKASSEINSSPTLTASNCYLFSDAGNKHR